MLGSGILLAQSLYVEPATRLARDVKGLFMITLVIATVVFIIVMGLLTYMLVKFRNNKRVPRDETHRGHTTAEIVWTVIPAAILLFLGFLSAGTLIDLDTVPDDTDFTIHAEASQFVWRFLYPDDSGLPFELGSPEASTWCSGDNRSRCSIGEVRVQEGSRVRIDVSARDVIHAFAVPEFSVKMDAVPGKPNSRWFEVPMLHGAPSAEYFIQCMEYCGVGHHDMRASLVVFPAGSQPLAWGRAPPPAATP